MVFKKKGDEEDYEVENDEELEKDSSTPFNSAVRTLETLHEILLQISMNDVRTDIPSIEKQSKKISLVRCLFMISYPLAIEELKPLKQEILNLNLNSCLRVEHGVQKYKVFYDFSLDKKLNEIVLTILEKLQEKNVFMPKHDRESSLF